MKYKKLLNTFFKPLFARLDSVRLVQIILLIVLIGIISFFKFSFNLLGGTTPGLATLVVNFETEKRFFEGEVFEDTTMLDALSAAFSVGKIKLNYFMDKSGDVNIVKIDGYINGVSDKHFIFYLNSRKIVPKNLNKKVVRNGDRIEIQNESR